MHACRSTLEDPTIVSDAFSRTHGRTLTLDGQPYDVIGVLPRDFSWLGSETPVLLPMTFAPGDNLNSHNNYFAAMVGRLRPGTTPDQSRPALRKFGQETQAEFPESRGLSFDLTPMRELMVGNLSAIVPMLLGAVAFVLLIACANLAQLVLARSAGRSRELAVRAALGASRAKLLRQLLTENLLLSALGGAAGLLLAFWAMDAINALGQDVLPRMQPVRLDARVLAFTTLVSMASGALIGLLPALRASRLDLRDSLNEAAPSSAPGAQRASAALVIAEVALSLVLLAGAGLLLRSMQNLLEVDTGFDPHGVLTAEIDLPAGRYVDERLWRAFSPLATDRAKRFFDGLVGDVRAIPGVKAAAAISSLPLAGENWGKRIVLWDRPLPATLNDLPQIQYRQVIGDGFAALGIRIRRGRAFTSADRAGAPKVAIVSRELARRHFGDGDPIGKEISVNAPRELDPSGPDVPLEKFTIVGVADDVRYGSLDRGSPPVVYVPYTQTGESTLTMFLAVRSDNPLAVLGPLRERMRRIDPDLPIANVSTFETRFSRSIAQPRLQAALLGLFAGVAVLLAALGIYGVMAVTVAQRTREIGIRLALGAERRDVVAMVLRRAVTLTGAGIAIGLGTALLLSRLVQSLLFGVGPSDPLIHAATVLLLSLVSLAASWVPARRAARIDPMTAIRSDLA